mmetsp:Transcript_85308/g.178262  ORF Transcript_85308/g.178262 Transcript_85308/m.178262 type:complete len:160 (+) Transcript_85308:84-563(+)
MRGWNSSVRESGFRGGFGGGNLGYYAGMMKGLQKGMGRSIVKGSRKGFGKSRGPLHGAKGFRKGGAAKVMSGPVGKGRSVVSKFGYKGAGKARIGKGKGGGKGKSKGKGKGKRSEKVSAANLDKELATYFGITMTEQEKKSGAATKLDMELDAYMAKQD